MSTLGRAEIVGELRRVMGLTERKASKALSLVLKVIRTALESGDNVHINTFGGWYPIRVPGRVYRSRKTGKRVRKLGARKIEFRPCARFRPGLPEDIE